MLFSKYAELASEPAGNDTGEESHGFHRANAVHDLVQFIAIVAAQIGNRCVLNNTLAVDELVKFIVVENYGAEFDADMGNIS